MSRTSKDYNLTLAPGEQRPIPVVGTFVKVRTCNLPRPTVTMAFEDEASVVPISENDSFPPGPKFQRLIFRNTSATEIAQLVVTVGDVVVEYDPADNRPASTYLKGNLGFALAGDIPGINNSILGSAGVNNAGTGYKVGDILSPAGGTVVAPAKIQVTKIGSNGHIAGWKIIDRGNYTVVPASPNNVTGGSGQGAIYNLNFTATAPLSFSPAASGLLRLQPNTSWFIDGFDGYSRRQQIIIYVITGGNGLTIQDMDGCTVMKVTNAAPITIQTDAKMQILNDTGGIIDFSIGETYLSQP